MKSFLLNTKTFLIFPLLIKGFEELKVFAVFFYMFLGLTIWGACINHPMAVSSLFMVSLCYLVGIYLLSRPAEKKLSKLSNNASLTNWFLEAEHVKTNGDAIRRYQSCYNWR